VRPAAELARYGVDLAMCRMIVLGPKTDVRAVALLNDAVVTGQGPRKEDDTARLARALAALEEVLGQKMDEADMYASQRARQSQVDANLTPQEQQALNKAVTNVFTAGTQGAIWSSMVMLLIGLAVLSTLRN
jgi:hypothetical protein